MMKTKSRHSPEQAQAEARETLLALLGAQDMEGALQSARALIETDPLMLTLTVNRITRRMAIVTNIATDRQRQDIELLLDAQQTIEKQLRDALIQQVEQAARQDGRQPTGEKVAA